MSQLNRISVPSLDVEWLTVSCDKPPLILKHILLTLFATGFGIRLFFVCRRDNSCAYRLLLSNASSTPSIPCWLSRWRRQLVFERIQSTKFQTPSEVLPLSISLCWRKCKSSVRFLKRYAPYRVEPAEGYNADNGVPYSYILNTYQWYATYDVKSMKQTLRVGNGFLCNSAAFIVLSSTPRTKRVIWRRSQ